MATELIALGKWKASVTDREEIYRHPAGLLLPSSLHRRRRSTRNTLLLVNRLTAEGEQEKVGTEGQSADEWRLREIGASQRKTDTAACWLIDFRASIGPGPALEQTSAAEDRLSTLSLKSPQPCKALSIPQKVRPAKNCFFSVNVLVFAKLSSSPFSFGPVIHPSLLFWSHHSSAVTHESWRRELYFSLYLASSNQQLGSPHLSILLQPNI
ncbi:hypothetical protein CCH79_00000263 [Gambusia affinis]|uniref:Uncharacterized protein n=1 Tax=Gambusia affinis TaxID=33528 RepID=A0A315VVN3_GAMAF|nr:hypothetical protein CCH79_00000263 [Gambusia affinis]